MMTTLLPVFTAPGRRSMLRAGRICRFL
ncbi:hypothetical protein ACLB1T_09720 [Escherichia coli]